MQAGTWKAVVRRKGVHRAKTFRLKVSDIIAKYRDEVTPWKISGESELSRRTFLEGEFGGLVLAEMNANWVTDDTKKRVYAILSG